MEGGWVSTLKDGQMVSLARDEFHERTTSEDIQLLMPRNQTKKNMEVVAHYLNVSAHIRTTLLENIIGKTHLAPFPSKGCGKSELQEQEQFIQLFLKKLLTTEPFKCVNRDLVRPFTDKKAKTTVKHDMLKS